MSNFLFNGFDFQGLNSSFKLQNVSVINSGETQQMNLPLLNNQSSGYQLSVATPYNSNPNFLLNYVSDNVATNLITYNPVNAIFEFNKGLDLKNASRISNSLDPVLGQDLVTKSFLQNSIGGLGNGSVTSVGLTTLTSGLSITGSPIIDNGTFNINLSTQLQNLSNLSSLGLINKVAGNTYNTISPGLSGQALITNSSGGFSFANVGTVTSVNITADTGITVTGGSIISNGTINLTLSSNLQSLSSLATDGIIYKNGTSLLTSPIPLINGQVPTSSNGDIFWTTPQSGGNVVGNNITNTNSLALWNNAIGTSLGDSSFIVDVSGNLNISSKRIVNAQDPQSPQDYTTKSFVEASIAILNKKFRSGTVIIGDIGSTGTRSRSVTGSILTATQSNGYAASSSFIDFTFSDAGYAPLAFFSWFDPTTSSVCNDIDTIAIQTSTNTTTRVFIEQNSSTVQNGTLNVMLVAPNL